MGYTKVLVGHCKYDFDVDGGAATAITPAMNFHIPIGAVVLRVTGIARTALASGTGAATVTLSHVFTAGEYDFYVEYLPSGDAN